MNIDWETIKDGVMILPAASNAVKTIRDFLINPSWL
jgi:hypothetical protein